MFDMDGKDPKEVKEVLGKLLKSLKEAVGKGDGAKDDCDCPFCVTRRRIFGESDNITRDIAQAMSEEFEMNGPHNKILSTDKKSFQVALKYLKKGSKLARGEWDDDRFLYYVPAASYPSVTDVAKETFGPMTKYQAYLALAIGDEVIPYSPTTEDVLAVDWILIK